jgi:histone acetyltransferase (RNA polymerase elongator complex component)
MTVTGQTDIEIGFFGGSFTGLPIKLQTSYLRAAFECKQDNLAHRIRLSTRPDYIDDSRCDFLTLFGVDTVELGAQSFDDSVLLASRRGHTSDDIVRAMSVLRRRQIKTVLQLLPGLPGDTEASMMRSARIAADLFPDAVRIYPAVVIAGTALETRFRDKSYTPLTLDHAVEICARMTGLFADKGIPVIRMGLHPVENKEEKIIAGPYHPAFGFLVKARIARNTLELRTSDFLRSNRTRSISITLSTSGAEEYIGHKKENIAWIASRFHLDNVYYSISEKTECVTISSTD